VELLFKREQTGEGIRGVRFKLSAKIELDEEEARMIDHYRFDNAILIESDESQLVRRSALIAVVVAFLLVGPMIAMSGFAIGAFLALAAGGGTAFWWFNEKRETILVNDLLQGRFFRCKSVIELAKKEAWLQNAGLIFRQVLEGSKHWDGTQHIEVPVLSPDDARELLVSL